MLLCQIKTLIGDVGVHILFLRIKKDKKVDALQESVAIFFSDTLLMLRDSVSLYFFTIECMTV